jgi:hypothetical protein
VRIPLPRASGISWGPHPHHGAPIVVPDSLVPREVAVGVQARLEGAAEKRARGVKGNKDGGVLISLHRAHLARILDLRAARARHPLHLETRGLTPR